MNDGFKACFRVKEVWFVSRGTVEGVKERNRNREKKKKRDSQSLLENASRFTDGILTGGILFPASQPPILSSICQLSTFFAHVKHT